MQSRVSNSLMVAGSWLAVVVTGVSGCSGSSANSTRPRREEPSTASVPEATEPVPASTPVPAPTAKAQEAPAEPPEPRPDVPADPPKADALELTFVGDVIFGRYRDQGYDPIVEDGFRVFEALETELRSDVLVGNLETPLIRELPSDSPIGARFRFGASLEDARQLADAGFSAMSLANNHWFDLRREGLTQTPELLEEIGVMPLGRARPGPPEVRVETLTAKGWRIGFVAVTARTNAPIREEVPAIPYVGTYDLDEHVVPVLEAARDDHDLLVVAVHWGDEYADEPELAQIMAAHALVDGGADLVIGHHPHVLQGIEAYGDGLIAYSLGNFLFENTHEPPRLTGVLRVRFDSDPRCLERVVFHPAYVKRYPTHHPVPARGYMARKVARRLEQVSRRFRTKWAADENDLVFEGLECEAENPRADAGSNNAESST